MKKLPSEIERAFTVTADERVVRTRLLKGMKKLGFKHVPDHEELKFQHGSSFADEPSNRMYITVKFDPDDHNHLIATLRVPVWVGVLFDWQRWTGVDAYYDSVLPLVEQIAVGDDAPFVKSFLDLSKRVGRNMILLWIVISGFIIALIAMPEYTSVNWSLLNFYSGVFLLAFFLIRIAADVYGYAQIKTNQLAISGES